MLTEFAMFPQLDIFANITRDGIHQPASGISDGTNIMLTNVV
jgi:hypothetical protein